MPGRPTRAGCVAEEVVVTKALDKASPKLAEAVCRATVFPKVEIHLTRSPGTAGRQTYYAYELKNVQVTSYHVATTAADSIPVEEVTLNFEEIKATYTEFDELGRSKGNVEYEWKVEEGDS
jgi:type VI secretion system secreted protein Hcp